MWDIIADSPVKVQMAPSQNVAGTMATLAVQNAVPLDQPLPFQPPDSDKSKLVTITGTKGQRRRRQQHSQAPSHRQSWQAPCWCKTPRLHRKGRQSWPWNTLEAGWWQPMCSIGFEEHVCKLLQGPAP